MFLFVAFDAVDPGSEFPLPHHLPFGIGLALGCDYPTAHMIISESIRA